MKILELLEYFPSLKVEISASELLETMRSVAEEIIERYEKKEQPEQYLTRKQASRELNVTLPTLWRWQKQAYLQPVEVGGRRKYKLSDINRILKTGV
jgi:hypothetical protein